ncbi:hypothetical protein PN498_28360 [Oscillatoria sp. CS-180]|uniref:hypothetical protein n=1 Tax=Oscillatoria sp. CS-180 TaxID=3021720 RepID=UPI00232F606A|nr:hypothetical protein [Oscillatoria sp. CS-180]MDB9529933.1 hypothetical protein [Oscillatoria sp. CS-180]
MMTDNDASRVTMPSPLLSVRVPQELMEAIAAAATDGNKSQVVIDILTAHFNPVPADEVGQLRRRLELVEQRLQTMEGGNGRDV